MLRLECAIQNYAWGKLGEKSTVAQLARSGFDLNIDPQKPYAELWMGTHPKGPSKILETGQLLSDWMINQSEEQLGKNLHGSVQLPFLFKVLSVRQALSIQVHPSQDEAKSLHSKDPQNYPDPNHKPEMAIALTDFEILCSFRPVTEILRFLHEIPELNCLIGQERVAAFEKAVNGTEAEQKAGLKQLFSALMGKSESELAAVLKDYSNRLKAGNLTSVISPELKELTERLLTEFPGDVGIFGPLFLNHFTLKPGEAVFLGPNEPHAYLFGDCVECMACSDNTIRAGLTPKFKDVQTLCEMLTYESTTPQRLKMVPMEEDLGVDSSIIDYRAPVPDFAVRKIKLTTEYSVGALETCSIILTICGEGKTKEGMDLKPGCVFLVPAGFAVDVVNVVSSPVVLFQAFFPG